MSELTAGNSGEAPAKIQPSTLKRGNRKTQNAEAWEWDIQSQSSGSTGVWRQTRTVDTKMEFHKMNITNNQYLTKICQFLHWVLGIKTVYATFGMEATKSNILMQRPFMSSSMKAAIELGLNYTENLEAYKKTNFEQVQNLFNQRHEDIDIGTFRRDSECEDDRKYITRLDEIDIVS